MLCRIGTTNFESAFSSNPSDSEVRNTKTTGWYIGPISYRSSVLRTLLSYYFVLTIEMSHACHFIKQHLKSEIGFRDQILRPIRKIGLRHKLQSVEDSSKVFTMSIPLSRSCWCSRTSDVRIPNSSVTILNHSSSRNLGESS
jgi:hypothetical protein